MKQLKRFAPYAVLLIALVLLFRQCKPIDMASIVDLIRVPKIDTVYLRPDTIRYTEVIERPVPKIIYKQPKTDTVIKVVTSQKDTLFIMVPEVDTVEAYSVNVYQDSIQADQYKLRWTAVTRGTMLSFNPYLEVYQPKIEITKTKQQLFLINPMAGVSLGDNNNFAYGLNLGYKKYSAALIRHGQNDMFLIGYQIKF